MDRRLIGAAVLLGLAVALGLAYAQRTKAGPTSADDILGQTSSRINYEIPAGTVSTVSQLAAINTARAITRAPATATVESARLGLYSDLGPHQSVLVWVVDLRG